MHDVKTMKLLTTEQVAELLCVTPHTLAVWRCEKRHDLAFVKVGRKVRYRPADVEAFIERQTKRAA